MIWLNKKGADLSVNVIIVAIIALLVLVILFAIFTGRMSWFNKGINSVSSSCSGGLVYSPVKTSPDCVKVPSTTDPTKFGYCCPPRSGE